MVCPWVRWPRASLRGIAPDLQWSCGAPPQDRWPGGLGTSSLHMSVSNALLFTSVATQSSITQASSVQLDGNVHPWASSDLLSDSWWAGGAPAGSLAGGEAAPPRARWPGGLGTSSLHMSSRFFSNEGWRPSFPNISLSPFHIVWVRCRVLAYQVRALCPFWRVRGAHSH